MARYGSGRDEERRFSDRRFDDRRSNHRDHYGQRSRSRDRQAGRSRDGNPVRSQRRYDGRGYDDRRRDRSRDRYGDNSRYSDHGHFRAERPRERNRSRDRSPVRDRDRERRRGRDEELEDRDSKRLKRDDWSPARSHGHDTKDRKSDPKSAQESQSPRPSADDEAEAARKERLQARVANWKKNVHYGEKKPESGASSPTVKIEDKSSPAPPTAASGETKASSPAPYAGKFDPKAIAKRAAAALEKQKSALGGDVVIPKSAIEASNIYGASVADNSKVAHSSRVTNVSKPLKGNAKISGFGLNKAAAGKSDKPAASKATASLDEDDVVERKLEKLPDMTAVPDNESAALADNAEEHRDIDDDIRTDDEEAGATREAARKRAEEAQAEQPEVVMTDGDDAKPADSVDVNMTDEEEKDPLDAFMESMQSSLPKTGMDSLPPSRVNRNEKAVFENDAGDDYTAVGDDTDDYLALTKKGQKKDIPLVDHSKIEYEPFRKAFYSEPVELAEMSQEDVDMLRLDLDRIAIKGKDAPKPILKWAQGGFGTQILDVIRNLKYEKPTPIQAQTLPAIMSGRDTIGIAKTGSGKTAAYLLPMFRHIKDQRPLRKLEGPISLIMAPTRDLALQIHQDCKPYLKALNLRAVCCYGGASVSQQIADLKRGAEIAVCTAGRLLDLLTSNSGRVLSFKRITYFVLDEADRMFDMGFEPQITSILKNIRPDRQTVAFSATFPKAMEALCRRHLNKPLEILVGDRTVVAPEVAQVIEIRSDDTKFKRLLQLLGELLEGDEEALSLIFVERQETADMLYKEIIAKGYPTVSIHGGREQADRDQALKDFKDGIVPVMVATSVAARGLDVQQLKLVVNYDCPNHLEDYVHRSGRTGRAGRLGTAVTFVTPEQDRYANFLVRALKDSGREIPEDLQKLCDVHSGKIEAGEAKKLGSGFGGRGIERLDQAREVERIRERKQYKTEGEPEEEDAGDKKKSESKQREVDKLVASAAGKTTEREVKAAEAPPGQPIIPTVLSEHLSNAMKVQKAATPPPAGKTKGKDAAKDAAKVAADLIDARLLGQKVGTRPGGPVDNRGPDAGAYHATLEINDFPQKARWDVTNRTNVAKILDSTGTSITNKGNFYAKDKQPKPGEPPKLYILVEGDTEIVVENAMMQLTRLLKEGTLAALEADSHAPASGRYKVV